MEMLWKTVNKPCRSEKTNGNIFLFLNTIIFTCLGLMVWLVVRFFALETIDWAICFAGYSGCFIGFIGGVLFLWRKI